jgi:hypothetical protein
VNFGVLGLRNARVVHSMSSSKFTREWIMFKVFMGKLACGVALSVGFVACGAGSEETPEDFATSDVGDGAEVISGEATEADPNAAAGGEEAAVGDAETSAAVEGSGLQLVDCYLNLVTCFPDRDRIFEETGILCVCQAPDLDQRCGTGLVDLECNI